MKKLCRLLPVALLFLLSRCGGSDQPDQTKSEEKSLPFLSYSVVAVHPHDTSYFTEGLEFYKGSILESTGLYGPSKLVRYNLETGRVEKEIPLDKKFFGEGITVVRDTVYQLTYKERTVHLYNANGLNKIGERQINTEGWGMTNDSNHIIATDGSNNLYYYEPGTFRLLKVQAVTENNAPAVNLNELEYVKGYIYANQWQYDYVLKIDPGTGQVVAKINLSDIVARARAKDPKAEVLNGLAYNPATGKFYVTGKNWPEIYEIQFPL